MGTLPKSATPALTARRRTILIVEDDAGVERLITSVLHQEGFRVFAAVDAPEALRVVASLGGAAVDVALVDIGLPGRSGSDLAKELQAQGVPHVVLMTGYPSATDPRVNARDRALPMLRKPFTRVLLLQCLRDVLA